MEYIQTPGHFPYRWAQVILPVFSVLSAIFDPNECSLSQLYVSELDFTKTRSKNNEKDYFTEDII